MGNAKYVTDEIGDAYTKWSSGNIIMITAATGSGKTHFILHALLKYAYVNKKRILYLVNRKILKEQLEKELLKIETELYSPANSFPDMKQIIFITTYQNIEENLRTGNNINYLYYYDYCIYDECHYFYNDSNFNTYTELSYDFLRYIFDKKIQIFISATMENMHARIINRGVNHSLFQPQLTLQRVKNLNNKTRHLEYSIESDYNYVNLKAIKDNKMLIEMILKNINVQHEKWLIFTDNIQEGKELKKILENSDRALQNDVIFIDAKYNNNTTASHAVDEIAQKQQITKRIVITTSVMDNGISLHDQNLRNLVITADTKESFIQMLGRKRTDGKKVTLYIFMRDKLHFQRRLHNIDTVLDFYRAHQRTIKELYTIKYTTSDVNGKPELHEDIFPPFSMSCYDFATNVQLQQPILNVLWQQPILNDIIQNRYPHAHEKLCYSFNGYIAFNSFSVERCMQLKAFYSEMIDKLGLDSNAFLIQQAEWIGISDETIEHLITDTTSSLRQRIEKNISSFTGRELDSNENKELKARIKDDIKQLAESKDEKEEKEIINNKLKTLNQNDRVISANDFNYFMELLELPYKMEKPNKSTFLITTIATNTQKQ